MFALEVVVLMNREIDVRSQLGEACFRTKMFGLPCAVTGFSVVCIASRGKQLINMDVTQGKTGLICPVTPLVRAPAVGVTI